MKKLVKIVCLILSVCFSACFIGCGVKNSAFTAMNTAVYIDLYGQSIKKSVEEEIKNTLLDLEEGFSTTKEGSFVQKINGAGDNSVIPATPLEREIVELAKSYHEFSSSKFNPAVYPLLELWQFAPKYPVLNFSVPSPESISEKLPLTDFSALSVSENGVEKPNAGIKIDFGGFLKGYGADKAGKILEDNGITEGYVSIGGSSIYLISVESLNIKHPENSASPIISVNGDALGGFSVSTSGTYERFYVQDEKTYSHIIDGKTGRPAEKNLLSATVICEDGSFADAMTTALCLCDYNPETPSENELADFMNKILTAHPTAQIYAVYNDGNYKHLITNAESSQYSLLDKSYLTKKI